MRLSVETKRLADEQLEIYDYLMKHKGFDNFSACGDIMLAVAIRRTGNGIQQSIDKLKIAIEKKK